MKVEEKGHTRILRDTKNDVDRFLSIITTEHKSFSDYNLILDLSHNTSVTIVDIKKFLPLSKVHRKGKKSFVIVAGDLDFNSVPAQLTVVPSLLEAHDIIEMEEIERDLGF